MARLSMTHEFPHHKHLSAPPQQTTTTTTMSVDGRGGGDGDGDGEVP